MKSNEFKIILNTKLFLCFEIRNYIKYVSLNEKLRWGPCPLNRSRRPFKKTIVQ